MNEREQTCRLLMGKAQNNWAKSFECPTPTQIMHNLELLEEAGRTLEGEALRERVALLSEIHDTLMRWGWFRKAGLATKPPWEITRADWEKLIELAPWNPSGQGDLFEAAR